MIDGHGGNIYQLSKELGCSLSDIIDMSSNVNPLGPPPCLAAFLGENLSVINALPEPDARSAISAFADRYNISPARITAGNGTTQLIHTLPPALKTKCALIVGPTYSDYADACAMHGVPYDFFITRPEDKFLPDMDRLRNAASQADLVFICNPNNPTGGLIHPDDLHQLCAGCPEAHFVIDESYLPFVDDASGLSMIHSPLPNVMVLNSMSKIFRIPGLRIGFLAAGEPVIRAMMHYYLPWSVNSLAQAAVIYLMTHPGEIGEFVDEARFFMEKEREYMFRRLKDAPGISPFQSVTSFILARLEDGMGADEVCRAMAEEKIMIRNCSNFKGLSDRYIRISLKKEPENRKALETLLEIIRLPSPSSR